MERLHDCGTCENDGMFHVESRSDVNIILLLLCDETPNRREASLLSFTACAASNTESCLSLPSFKEGILLVPT